MPQLRKWFWHKIVAAKIARHTPRMVGLESVPFPLIFMGRMSDGSLLRQFGNPFFLLLFLIFPAVRFWW